MINFQPSSPSTVKIGYISMIIYIHYTSLVSFISECLLTIETEKKSCSWHNATVIRVFDKCKNNCIYVLSPQMQREHRSVSSGFLNHFEFIIIKITIEDTNAN